MNKMYIELENINGIFKDYLNLFTEIEKSQLMERTSLYETHFVFFNFSEICISVLSYLVDGLRYCKREKWKEYNYIHNTIILIFRFYYRNFVLKD